MEESSVQSTLIADGYAAFNSDDWETVEALFCADTPPENPEFPRWDDVGLALRGRDAIFAHLRDLRQGKVKAKLLAVADHGHHSITLDISTGGAGPHACPGRTLGLAMLTDLAQWGVAHEITLSERVQIDQSRGIAPRPCRFLVVPRTEAPS